jgi:tetrahydromethanopterin S-methyltransferase subunit G
MDARLSLIESRLEQIEQRLEQLNQSSISRSEWIDISARLDIVEKNSNETIHKIRQRLDGFTKEVRQIAVVPERELQEMHSLMHSIRAFLQPDASTPPLRSGRSGNR